MNHKTIFIIMFALLAAAGCTKSPSDSGDRGGSSQIDPNDTSGFRTNCGTVYKGSLRNPASPTDGKPASLTRVLDSNTVVLNVEGQTTAVKLHGLGKVPAARESAAMQQLSQLALGELRFFQATDDCVVPTTAGATGLAGHIFNASGKHFGEALISNGLRPEVQNGSCNEELVSICYSALRDSITPPSAGSVRSFLWKPEAEGGINPGGLVVLTDVCSAHVIVNGETLVDAGASNGRCTTARSANKSGCDYGSNVTVEVVDARSGRPYLFPDGKDSYNIPNGCGRVEFG